MHAGPAYALPDSRLWKERIGGDDHLMPLAQQITDALFSFRTGEGILLEVGIIITVKGLNGRLNGLNGEPQSLSEISQKGSPIGYRRVRLCLHGLHRAEHQLT